MNFRLTSGQTSDEKIFENFYWLKRTAVKFQGGSKSLQTPSCLFKDKKDATVNYFHLLSEGSNHKPFQFIFENIKNIKKMRVSRQCTHVALHH